MMEPMPARREFADLTVGQRHEVTVTLSSELLEKYLEFSGDRNPLHCDDEFARQHGFAGRVVHGMLLGGLISRFLGVDFIGAACLIHRLSLQFHRPGYLGDSVTIRGEISQKTEYGNTVVIAIEIRHATAGHLLCRAEAQVGMTHA